MEKEEEKEKEKKKEKEKGKKGGDREGGGEGGKWGDGGIGGEGGEERWREGEEERVEGEIYFVKNINYLFWNVPSSDLNAKYKYYNW